MNKYTAGHPEMSYQALKGCGGNLNACLLSERDQPGKATSCMIPSVGHSGKGKIMETIKRSVAARGDIGGVHRWNTENFSGSENTL